MEHNFPTTLRTYHLNPSTTSREVLYTCPAKHTAILKALFLANTGSSSVDTDIELNDLSNGGWHMIYHTTAAGKSTNYVTDTVLFVLEAGDQIGVTTASANSVDVILTVAEMYDPARNP